MKKIFVIAKKELSWYFNNPVGYVLLGLFAALANFLAVRDIFLRNQASAQALFTFLPWLLLVLAAAVAMRAIAEEKKSQTLEVLLTLPVTESQIVVGKFIGLSLFMTATLVAVLPVPLTLVALGSPDIGIIVAGFLAACLLSLALLAIGLFISTISKNQVGAVFTSLVVFFLIMVIGSPLITDQLPRFVRSAFFLISPSARYESLAKGVVDIRDIVYFFSVMVGFLYLSVETLQRRT